MIGAEHLKMSSNIVNLAMKSEELTVLNLYLHITFVPSQTTSNTMPVIVV